MAVSLSLKKKLREALGQDAGEDLVTFLEQDHSELGYLRADLAEFRQEMHRDLGDLRALMAKNHAELLKWSFVFWVGAVSAIAALAGALK